MFDYFLNVKSIILKVILVTHGIRISFSSFCCQMRLCISIMPSLHILVIFKFFFGGVIHFLSIFNIFDGKQLTQVLNLCP